MSRIKSQIHRITGSALKGGLLRPLTQTYFQRCVPIFLSLLMAQRLCKKRLFWGHSIDDFREEMRFLRSYFQFVGLDDILDLNERGNVPERAVAAITFDDGHSMAGTSAVALLEEFGITATLFVVTSCVNNKRLRWMHALNAVAELRGTDRLLRETDRVFGRRKLDLGISSHSLSVSTKAWPMELKDEIVAEIFQGADMPPMVDYLDEYRPYADWDELKELARRGHRIGLHTRTHPFCSQISTDAIEIEIIAPSRELRARLGVNKLAFAYPFGDRLPNPEIEQRTCERAELSCMLGICGLSRWGTRRWQLDRVDAERGVAVELFSRPMLRAARERFPMASNRRREGTNIA